MRVIFFGAGKFASNIWEEVVEKPQLYTDEYLAFVDNNVDLWGTTFGGKPVIAPLEIKRIEVDLVVIVSIYENSIRKQLTEELDIAWEKIYSYGEYFRKCFAKWRYKRKYGEVESDEKSSKFNINNFVIYTAITGEYDELKEPCFISSDVTYVCITNNSKLKSKVWEMEYIKDDTRDNTHLARHIKMNPQIFFHGYETSVWVDGKYQVRDDLRKYISLYQKESNILCFPHPERECICDELAACIALQRGNKKDMVLQVSDYLKKGYPINQGLYETGCIVRVHNDEQVKFIMNKWENELLKYSIRDQLSFPYVCWENDFEPDICSLDINRNQWLLQRRTLY